MTSTPRPARTNLDISQEESSDSLRKDTQKPPPLRSILTKPVLLSIANYAMLALLEMAIVALIPLVWSTSVEFGGLGFEPALIGLWMSVYGCMNGLFLFTVFPRVIGRFGLRRVLITCITFYAVVVIMFPLENLVLLHATGGSTMTVWPLIFLQLSSLSVFMMGYCKFLLFTREYAGPEFNVRSSRCWAHVYQFGEPKQAITGRGEWLRADGGLNSVRIRTSSSGFAFCLFRYQQRFGRKLCICGTAHPGVHRVVHRRASSEKYVDAHS